jgi:hypothetical protein
MSVTVRKNVNVHAAHRMLRSYGSRQQQQQQQQQRCNEEYIGLFHWQSLSGTWGYAPMINVRQAGIQSQ